MLLDAAETVLGIFGFDRTLLPILTPKQQLLEKIFSQEEDGGNDTASQKISNLKTGVSEIKNKILEEAGVTLSKDEEKQVNQDDSKILSVHTAKVDNNCPGRRCSCRGFE